MMKEQFSGGRRERLFTLLSFLLGYGRMLWVWLWQALGALLWLSRVGFKYGKISRCAAEGLWSEGS